jgi:hypothetical protein
MVVQVDGSTEGKTQVKLVFILAADEFPVRKPAHAHERFAFESPAEREAFLFAKTREQLKVRQLLPQL